MSASLCMSMASLAVSGAGRGATVARMGRAATVGKGAVAGSAFMPAKTSAALTMKSSLAGVVMPRAVAARKTAIGGRGALVVVAGGRSIGCTLHGTRRARARTSGFRARLATPTGRKVLKARRKKGRKYLAPACAVNGWNREKKKSLK